MNEGSGKNVSYEAVALLLSLIRVLTKKGIATFDEVKAEAGQVLEENEAVVSRLLYDRRT